jgi:uncharacterized protein YdhG (YjbR/CyaY superfamily)
MNSEVERFIDAIPDDRRPLFDQLQEIILGMYPEADIVISYGVPTYRAKSGWVSLGYWKGGVSIYTNGPHNISGFKEKHPEIKTGKGSINFKVSEKIPVADLKKVIRHAVERPKAG